MKMDWLCGYVILAMFFPYLFHCDGSQLKTFCHMNEAISCSAFSFSCNNRRVINVTDVWYRSNMSCDTNFCCCQSHINWTVNWSENHTQDIQELCNGNASCDVENYLKNMTGKITVMYSCETSTEEHEPDANSTNSTEQTSTSQITHNILTATHSSSIITETSSRLIVSSSLSTPADTTSNDGTTIVSDTSNSAGTPDTSKKPTSTEASANGNTKPTEGPHEQTSTSQNFPVIVTTTATTSTVPETLTNCDSKIVTAVLVSVCLTAFITTFLFLLKRHTNCRTRRRQQKVNTHVEIANNMYEDLIREEIVQENVYSQANPEMS